MAITLQFTGQSNEYIDSGEYTFPSTWEISLGISGTFAPAATHELVKVLSGVSLSIVNQRIDLTVNGNSTDLGPIAQGQHQVDLVQTATTIEVWIDNMLVGDSGVDTLAPGESAIRFLTAYDGTVARIEIGANSYLVNEGVGLTLWNDSNAADALGPLAASPAMYGQWSSIAVQYATRLDVEFIYGKTNVAKWADLENNGDDAEIAGRINYALSQSVNDINDRLRSHRYTVPFAQPTPAKIIELSAIMTGLWLYQWRGVTDYDPTNGTVDHQLSRFENMAKRELNAILSGQMTLDAIGHTATPSAGFPEVTGA